VADRSTKAEEVLDVAERMARSGGYNGFSFREIAKVVGIKAASVHYHFPTKDALGAAVARRYTDRFLATLGDADDPAISPEASLRRYVDGFRKALRDEGLMCLCGVLGAEIGHLPAPVAAEARRFFELNVRWLTKVFDRNSTSRRPAFNSRAAALWTIAALEGGMILARTMADASIFDDVAASVVLPSKFEQTAQRAGALRALADQSMPEAATIAPWIER
jgi:TetR/AcrR family transcriptional regulator, transcriptional repressor for nem operon